MCVSVSYYKVLDRRGYVKLVDLGLAKQVSEGTTW